MGISIISLNFLSLFILQKFHSFKERKFKMSRVERLGNVFKYLKKND